MILHTDCPDWLIISASKPKSALTTPIRLKVSSKQGSKIYTSFNHARGELNLDPYTIKKYAKSGQEYRGYKFEVLS